MKRYVVALGLICIMLVTLLPIEVYATTTLLSETDPWKLYKCMDGMDGVRGECL